MKNKIPQNEEKDIYESEGRKELLEREGIEPNEAAFTRGYMEEAKEPVTVRNLKITSPSFQAGKRIPEKYTCDGEDINPPLEIENIPKDAKSLVLILDDPDAPAGSFVHWIVFNIPVKNKIEEDSIPGDQALNDFKRMGYGGPCPPGGTHRYFFRIYAIDKKIETKERLQKEDIMEEISNHILASGYLIGKYSTEPREETIM